MAHRGDRTLIVTGSVFGEQVKTEHKAKKKVEAKGHQAKQEAKNKLKDKGQQAKQKANASKQEAKNNLKAKGERAKQKAEQKRGSRPGGSIKSKGY